MTDRQLNIGPAWWGDIGEEKQGIILELATDEPGLECDGPAVLLTYDQARELIEALDACIYDDNEERVVRTS